METAGNGKLAALQKWEQACAVAKEVADDQAALCWDFPKDSPDYARYQLYLLKTDAAEKDMEAAALAVVDAYNARDPVRAVLNGDPDPDIDEALMADIVAKIQLPRDLVEAAAWKLRFDANDNADAYGPALTIADADALSADLLPLIPYLAWPGLKTVYAAREKAGKSSFAMAGAAAASRGDAFLGTPLKQQRVLWLSEEPTKVVMRRVKAMRASPTHFFVVSMVGVADPLALLAHHVARVQPDIIVIDSVWYLARQYVHDENSSAQWTPVLDPIEQYAEQGAGVLLLAHANKGDTYRGSTAVGAFADVLIEMKNPPKGATVRSLTVLSRIETTDAALDLVVPPDGYELVGAKTTERATDAEVDAKVLAHVRKHPGTTQRQAQRATHKGVDTVRHSLARLVLAGKIEPTAGNPVTYTAKESV